MRLFRNAITKTIGYVTGRTNGANPPDSFPNVLTNPVKSWFGSENGFHRESAQPGTVEATPPRPVERIVAKDSKVYSAPAETISDPLSVIERDSTLNYQPKNSYENHVRDVIKSFKVDHMPQRKQEPDADYKSRMSPPLPFYETRPEVTEYFRRGQILKDRHAMWHGSDSAKETPLIGKYIDEKKARLEYEIDEGKIPSIVPMFENDIGNFALFVDSRIRRGKNLEESIKSAIAEFPYPFIKTNADAFEAYILARENADKVEYEFQRALAIKQQIASAKASLMPKAPAQYQHKPAGGMYNTAKKFISGLFGRR